MRRLTALAIAACLFQPAALCAQESRGLVYDFGATWCGPCQQVAPIVEKLQREGLPISKVDIDKQRELANQYNVQSIPTFVLVVDGKEVDRTTGRLTEADLRRMVARIPATAPQVATPSAQQPAGSMSIPVNLGEPAPLVRPEPMQSQPAQPRLVEDESNKSLRDLIPFGRKKDEAPAAVVRGNDSAVSSEDAPVRTASAETTESEPVDPMSSSVRIRVVTNGKIDMGSGTVVSSKVDNTQILTCAHIFKEFTDNSQILVDVFERGGSTQYVARLVKFDATSDLGLISIPTPHVVPQIPVAGTGAVPKVADPVAAIGCSGGAEPTRQQSRVTDIDKYEGPHNLLCTGVPVRGRSGGGLFNSQGEIVGVCSAADEQEQRGFYSGLLAIHKLLDECQLTALYAPAVSKPADVPERSLAAADVMNEHTEAAPPVREMPVASQSVSQNEHSSPVDVQAGDAEVVVIIRDRSNPALANRVVILHQASPKFMSYLSGELTEGELNMDLMGATKTQPRNVTGISREPRQKPSAMMVSYERTTESGSLRPTTLSQPVVPQKYTRSRPGQNCR